MVSRIDHLGDARHTVFDHDLDTLLEGDIDHPASLAAAAEGDDGLARIHTNQVDVATVRGYYGVDLAGDDIGDRLGEFVHPHRVGVVEAEAAAHKRLLVVERGAFEVPGTTRRDEHLHVPDLYLDVVLFGIIGADELQVVLETLRPPSDDLDSEAQFAGPFGLRCELVQHLACFGADTEHGTR